MRNHPIYFFSGILDKIGVPKPKRYRFFKNLKRIEYGFYEPGLGTAQGLTTMKRKDYEKFKTEYHPRKMWWGVEVGKHYFLLRII